MTDNDAGVRKRAYQATDYTIVEQGNLELPTSTPAPFTPTTEIDTADLQNKLTRAGYCFIAPYTKDNFLSSKVYDSETNEFFHIKAYSNGLNVFPKSDDFSFETFERFLDTVEEEITELEYNDDD